jgi:hypothetical protein
MIIKFLASAIGKWLLGGSFGLLLIGGVILWHNSNFVAKVEVEYWKKYSEQLIAGIEKQKELLRQYEETVQSHEEELKKLEEENDRLYREESKGDNPVILDRSDVERLRQFKESIR